MRLLGRRIQSMDTLIVCTQASPFLKGGYSIGGYKHVYFQMTTVRVERWSSPRSPSSISASTGNVAAMALVSVSLRYVVEVRGVSDYLRLG
jgi:hypothetical protein